MTPEEKSIIATVRRLLKDELKERTSVKAVRKFNSKLVPADRHVRETADGSEPRPLKFGGNPYVIIWTDQMYGERDIEPRHVRFSRQLVHEAWKSVVTKNFPDNRLAIDGVDHILLDPEFDVNGRILFGFTGLKVPPFQPLPAAA